MNKSMNILRNKLNQLEADNLKSAQTGDEVLQCPISDDKEYTKEFYDTLDFLHKNYPKAYKRVAKKFHLMTLDKGFQTLKAYRTKLRKKTSKRHTDLVAPIDKQEINPLKKVPEKLVRFDTSDGMYQVGFIRFFIVRFIINEFRLLLHVPMNKEDVAIEVVKDLSFDDNGIIEAGNDYNNGDISDSNDMDLAQEDGDEDLKYTKEISLPMINRLQDLVNSKHDWFNITNFKYSLDEDDEDYSIHFKSIPNDTDVPKYSKKFNDFKAKLNQINTNEYDVDDLDKLRELYDNLNDLFDILTNSLGDMFWD